MVIRVGGGYISIDEFIDQIPSKHVQLEKDPEQKKVSLEAKGVSALLFCQEEKLVIEAEFGWILRAFQSKIDQGIDRWLDHAMGGTKSLKSGAKE